MKKLLISIMLLPFLAQAQVNTVLQKTAATGTVRSYSVGPAGTDTLAAVRLTGVINGMTLIYNSTTKKFHATAVAAPDSAAFRTVANSRSLAQTQTALNLKANLASPTFTGTPLAPTASPGNNTTQLATTAFVTAAVSASPSGTVTSVSAITLGTSGSDLSSSVANSTTTPVITLNVPTASASNRGVVSAADWSTFNGKQATLSGTGIVKSTGGTISYLTDPLPIANGGTGSATFTATSPIFYSSGVISSQAASGSQAGYVTTGAQTFSGVKTFTDDVQIPAIPVNATSAASKNYIDNLITGITWKAAVKAATTANITLSGAQTIDGYSALAGDRILVKNQTTQANNGIYLVASGAWTRTTDADTGAEIETATVMASEGTVNGDTQWTCTASSITLGTTAITFGQIAGAGVYTNGTGLTLTGNVFAIDGTVATLAGSQTLTNKTLTTPVINGTITGTTVIPIANGGTGSATQNFVDLTTGQTIAGIKTFGDGVGDSRIVSNTSQPFGIQFKRASGTSVLLGTNTSGDLLISNNLGTVVATVFQTGTATFTGTVTAPTFIGALTGNASTATTAGTVTTAAQPNITSVGTLTGLTLSGATNGTSLTMSGAINGASATLSSGGVPLKLVSTVSTGGNNPWIKLRQADASDYGADIGIDVVTGGDFYISRVEAGTATQALRIARSTGNVGIGTTNPATSAILDVSSTTGAFLPPRMTTTQRDALTAVDGMIIYNSTTGALNYRKAGVWVAI